MTTPSPAAAARASGIRRLLGRVPGVVFVVLGMGLVVLLVALLGGFADAPPKPLPRVEAGQPHVAAQLTIAVTGASLAAAVEERYLEPEPGNELLLVRVTIENTWHSPVSTRTGSGAADNFRPQGLGLADDPLDSFLVSDLTGAPLLQPGIPTELVFVWEVPVGVFDVGQSIEVDLYDKVYRQTGFVTAGERFEDPFLAAQTQVLIESRAEAPAEDEADSETDSEAGSETSGATDGEIGGEADE